MPEEIRVSLRPMCLAAALLAASGLAAAGKPRIRYPKPEDLFGMPSFSQVKLTRPGTLVFLSGQTSTRTDPTIIRAKRCGQTEETFENLKVARDLRGAHPLSVHGTPAREHHGRHRLPRP